MIAKVLQRQNTNLSTIVNRGALDEAINEYDEGSDLFDQSEKNNFQKNIKNVDLRDNNTNTKRNLIDENNLANTKRSVDEISTGLGPEAALRYQKAQMRVLRDELTQLQTIQKELVGISIYVDLHKLKYLRDLLEQQAKRSAALVELEQVQDANTSWNKKLSQTQTLLTKQKNLQYVPYTLTAYKLTIEILYIVQISTGIQVFDAGS